MWTAPPAAPGAPRDYLTVGAPPLQFSGSRSSRSTCSIERRAPGLDGAPLAQRTRQPGQPGEPPGDLHRRQPTRAVAAQLDQPAPAERARTRPRQAAHRAPRAVARHVEARAGMRPVVAPRRWTTRAARHQQRVPARQHGAEREVDVLVVQKEALLVAAERVEDVAPEDGRRPRRGEDGVGLGGKRLERAVAQQLVGVAGGGVLVAGALDPARGADEHAAQRPRALVARRARQLRQPVRGRRGVGVQHADPGRRRRAHATVGPAAEAEVAPELQRAHLRVPGAQQGQRAVARAVVGDDDLLRRQRLRGQRREAVGQQRLAVVVDDDHRDAGPRIRRHG